MKKIVLTCFVLIGSVFSLLAQDKSSNKLTIEITGIEKKQGNVLIAVFNTEDDFLKKPMLKKVAKVEGNTVKVDFEGIANGTYAFSLFQDLNENMELDKGTFGIPSEPYAFSNNASGFMGPASFEDSSFKLEGKEVKQTIKLN